MSDSCVQDIIAKLDRSSVCSGGTHVFRGLDMTCPSSRTIPTPTLLAEPSMPRQYVTMASYLPRRTQSELQAARADGGGAAEDACDALNMWTLDIVPVYCGRSVGRCCM
jgi:hypothetical protein